MSSSGERTHLKLLTVGDLGPQADQRAMDGSAAEVPRHP